MTRARTRAYRHQVAFYLPSISSLLTGASTGPAGGAQTQVFLLARALAQRGVSVCVVAFPSDGMPASVDGVDIVVREPSRAHQRLVGKLRELARMRRAVLAADAPVVVGRVAGVEVGLAALASRLAGRRFIYSSASYLDFDYAGRRADRMVYRLGLRLADQIVVQTQEQLAVCRAAVQRPAQVIRSIAEEVPREAREPTAFLWIGRVYPNKRPLLFVELARACPDAQFQMVAVPSPGYEALYSTVKEAGALLPNFELRGPQPREGVVSLIASAVAVVSTSEYEGMPNVLLEAWARGVPALVLSHDPDGVIRRHGLGEAADGQIDALVNAVGVMWDRRGANSDLGDRCRSYVAEWHSGARVAESWERVLLSENGASSIREESAEFDGE
jgi:glycosyltransferase involved in cell wall biosynthesis